MSKNMKKFKPKDILEILWIDSHHQLGWLTYNEIQEFLDSENDFLMHTIGYFLSISKAFIYVIQTYDSQKEACYDSIIAIPNASILKINKLK